MADDSRLPSYHVRPGVTFPDWAAVTSPRAREALLAIFEAIGIKRMWRDYTPAEDDVRTALLRLYAEQGGAPAIADLARHAGDSPAGPAVPKRRRGLGPEARRPDLRQGREEALLLLGVTAR